MPDLTPDEELAEIQETNARFYRALESRDLEAMDAVWLHADYVRCIHPGWCLLGGWDTVRRSWEAIFKDSRELRFTLSDLQIQVEGDLAWVTGTENILTQSQGNISAERGLRPEARTRPCPCPSTSAAGSCPTPTSGSGR